MLINLQVRDFAIVDQISVEFLPGMTVLTGETGAGKSILVDAVGLVLGERGGSQLVRSGAKRAEFSAEFNISGLPDVRHWLEEHALDQDEECLLRRVIGADGRSRAFINGNPTPVQQLKTLGELLLDIHGQHFHQSLGRKSIQRDLLDSFGGLLPQRTKTELAFKTWQELKERLEQLQNANAERDSRLDLLTFQLQELESLNIVDDEIASLHAERQRLQNSGRLAEGISNALNSLYEDDAGNANKSLADASRAIGHLVKYDGELKSALEMLETASIQVSEATDSLQRYSESVDMDPARRDWVEERLDAITAVARKHRVDATALAELRERLNAEYEEITHADARGKELEEQVATSETGYRGLASALSNSRRKAARKFSKAVTEAMSGLGMPDGQFTIEVSARAENDCRAWGMDNIEFLISANPGQPLMPLARIASGGELSRMSLSIQVIASDCSAIPTMIFDEVDSGVGGGVAEMVGRRLRELGHDRQVLCVTHLPQVASLADQHFRISKVSDGKATRTGVSALSREERIEELARMLGGVEITQKTIEHATEMLAGASRKSA
jgi:DNA repair protein RecN (Recombination protein N)